MEKLPFLRQLSRRQRNVLWACCAVGAGGYISYQVYSSPPVVEKRQQLSRFFHSLSSLLETAAQGSECAGNLWKDLRTFLLSDGDEVPQTLKQMFKIGQTLEFRTSMALLCASVTQGVLIGMSEHGSLLQDEEVKKALFEELSSPREAFRQAGGQPGRDLGYDNRGNGDRRSWKGRRWRSSGDGEIPKYELDDETYYRRGGKSERIARGGSRIEEHDERLFWRPAYDADDYRAWRTSRRKYSERGSSSAAHGTEASREEGRRKLKAKREWKGSTQAQGIPDKLLGKVFSEAGRHFASAVVASAARSFVLSVLEGTQEMKKRDPNFSLFDIWSLMGGKEHGRGEFHSCRDEGKANFRNPASHAGMSQSSMIEFFCSRKGKALIADCIETFIGTAVTVYLERTRDVNFCDRLISTVSKVEHREPVKDLLSSVCSRAVESLVRTSHEAISLGWSAGPRQPDMRSTRAGVENPGENFGESSLSRCTVGQCSCCTLPEKAEVGAFGDFGRSGVDDYFSSASPCRTPDKKGISDAASASGTQGMKISFDQSPQSGKLLRINSENVEAIDCQASTSRQLTNEGMHFPTEPSLVSQGWIDGVSRTLAVPSNRALVLDVAGTVTAEAVRSTIDVVASKVSLTFRGKSSGAQTEGEGKPSSSKVLKVINRTGEIAQATAAKAMVGMTMCIAICLHTLVGPSRVFQLA